MNLKTILEKQARTNDETMTGLGSRAQTRASKGPGIFHLHSIRPTDIYRRVGVWRGDWKGSQPPSIIFLAFLCNDRKNTRAQRARHLTHHLRRQLCALVEQEQGIRPIFAARV